MSTATQTPTARSHYAAMRRYEDAARSLSVRLSVRGAIGGLAGEISADEIAEMKAQRDSYYLHAAAYRAAGRRRERADRFWATRPGTILRIALRGIRNVQSAVTA
ncbi:hypothetical protein ABT150_23275 [Streptomyces mirabilis]|uniref:hypothetical protein n=1 Tax=Streptomyces mirabilis TaxID=68239 RepID=UPI003316D860